MKFKPSKYQKKIFEFIEDGKGHAIIDAKAGSGKTTTILKALEFIDEKKSVTFLAFNKNIADSIKAKIAKMNVECDTEVRTLNSLGHKAWMAHTGIPYNKIKLDTNKVNVLVRAFIDGLSRPLSKEMSIIAAKQRDLTNLVKKAKIMGIMPIGFKMSDGMLEDNAWNWNSMIAYFEMNFDGKDADFIECARQILKVSAEMQETIDFDDQFYMPLIYNASWEHTDFLFVDEAQDVSSIQREVLKRSIGKKTRLVAVGDPRQSIYGFRGADPDSMNVLQKAFKAKVLYLNVCYRCPKSVIIEAQKIVPEIEASKDASEGHVLNLKENYKDEDFYQDDIILCRYNAPLIKVAYRLIGKRISCQIRGRQIGQGLVTLIQKMNTNDISHLRDKVQDWFSKEVDRVMSRDPDASIDFIEDKYNGLIAIIDSSKSHDVNGLIQEIKDLFRINEYSPGDDLPTDVLTLSSIHKAKGLEFKRVFIINYDSWPQKKIMSEWQKKQEENIKYVAVTRAMETLVFITDQQSVKMVNDLIKPQEIINPGPNRMDRQPS